MKINQINNTNFKALIGKKEVNYFHGSCFDSSRITHHIHPFKDEFKTIEDQQKMLNNYIATLPNKGAKGEICKHQFVIEKPLTFTREEFLYARRYPNAQNASQEAKAFANSNYDSIVINRSGFYPASIIE